MTEFRIFFLDAKGAIEARQELYADSDETAIAISALVYEACSDTYSGFELWSFDRRVVAANPGVGKIAEFVLDDITRDMQERVLEFEDTIQRSHWRVAHSKKLIDATNALRDILGRDLPEPDPSL